MRQITQTSDKTAYWYRSAPSRICTKKKKGVQQESFDHTWVLSSFLKCVLSGYVPDSQHKWLTWEPDQSVISDLADESDRFPPDRASGLTHWQWSIVQDSTVACSDALMGSAIGPSAVKLQCWSSMNQDSVTLTLIFLTSDVFRNTLHCFVSNFRTFLVRPSVFFVLEKEPRTLVPFSFCDWFVGLFKALFKLAFVPDLLTDLKVLYEQPWHEPLTTNWQNVPNCRQLLDCSNFSDYKSIYWTAQKIFWNRFTLLVVSKLGKPSEI